MFNKTRASLTATLGEDSEDPVTNERPGARLEGKGRDLGNWEMFQFVLYITALNYL